MEKQKTDFERKYVVYTDGSANNMIAPFYGACACVILDEKSEDIIYESSKGYKETTNNRCEIMAFIEALKHIHPNSYVDFYTDSQYCKTVLNLGKARYPKNMDLIFEFRDLCFSNRIKFKIHWVRGHSGNKWNEYVDKLANDAYEKISGEKQINWKDKKQVYEMCQRRTVQTIDTLKNSIEAHFQYHFGIEEPLQAIFDSMEADEIVNTFLDWALNNVERLDNFKL